MPCSLRRIAEFYAVEADIRGISPGQRLSARQTRTAPLVAAFAEWLQAQRRKISAKSRLVEKFAYIHNHWDRLQTFLTDGRVEIDSIRVENLIRPIAPNRKNSLFAGHDEGALYHTSTYASVISWLFEVDRQVPGVFRGVHRLLFERCLSQKRVA